MSAARPERFATPPDALTESEFMAQFGGIYEESPWVARIVWWEGESSLPNDVAGLHACMRRVVARAPRDIQLALMRAHPDLAGRAALASKLSDESEREQAGAGLDRCTPDELAEFHRLNDAYRARFRFPFIVAVGGLQRAQILELFRLRLDNSPAAEFRTALDEIHKIARLRLASLARADGEGR